MAYMEIFGNCSQNNNEFLRYSVPAYSLSQTSDQLSEQSFNITHSQTMSLAQQAMTISVSSHQISKPPIPSPYLPTTNIMNYPNISSNSGSSCGGDIKPPALPPKSSRNNSISQKITLSPPSSPLPVETEQQRHISAPPLMLNNSSQSPTQIKVSSPGGHITDRDGYEHICEAISQPSLSSPSNSVMTNNNNLTTTTVLVNDDDEQVVLRRNLRDKVLINFIIISTTARK